MKRPIGCGIGLLMLGCTTSTPVIGPDGTQSQLISCQGSMEYCLDEAREVCHGDYQIQSQSTNVSGVNDKGVVATTQEILVTCGSPSALESGSTSTPSAPAIEFAGSDAPTGAGGIEFGQSEAEIQTVCEAKQNKWKRSGETATCSGLLDEVGYPGKVRVKFCDEKACEIRLNLDLQASGADQNLLSEYIKLHGILAEKYGKPQVAVAQAYGECKNDLLRCLKDDTAKLKSNWRWKNGIRLSLKIFAHEEQPITYLEYISTKQAKKAGL